MTHKIGTLLIMTACCLFAGCDPEKLLIIKASGESTALVRVYCNKSILLQQGSTNEKVIISLPTTDDPPKKDTTFRYLIGSWSREDVDKLTKGIDSIVIGNSSGNKVIADTEGISNYLLKHRSGYGKSKLTIEAK